MFFKCEIFQQEGYEMRFVTEKDLREQFWKMYRRGNRNIVAYQFECQARSGGVDLLTVEKVMDREGRGFHLEICSFEFKLSDLEKAFSQANLNASFSHKTFVVVPAEKEKTIEDRYADYYKRYPSIGCIGVNHPDADGRYTMFHKAKARKDEEISLNQEILKLCCKLF